MEEQKETTPETPAPAAPADTPQQEPPKDGGQPAQEKKGRTVLEVTVDGKDAEVRDVRFHTPTLLQEVQKLPDGAAVKVVAESSDGTSQVLLDANKADAIKALEASIVKPEDIVKHFQHLVQFMADHSTLRAVGIEAIHTDAEGKDTGFGFVVTSQDCTTAQAVELVNCGEANMAEFVLKAKLDIPGRTSPAMGNIVAPTPEQVKQLGK